MGGGVSIPDTLPIVFDDDYWSFDEDGDIISWHDGYNFTFIDDAYAYAYMHAIRLGGSSSGDEDEDDDYWATSSMEIFDYEEHVTDHRGDINMLYKGVNTFGTVLNIQGQEDVDAGIMPFSDEADDGLPDEEKDAIFWRGVRVFTPSIPSPVRSGGGVDGNFVYHLKGLTVREMTVFPLYAFGKIRGITGIQLKMFDDQETKVFVGPDIPMSEYSHTHAETFTFQPGEVFAGNIIIGVSAHPYAAGFRTPGYIHFETRTIAGGTNKFEFGERHTTLVNGKPLDELRINADGRVLSGIHGTALNVTARYYDHAIGEIQRESTDIVSQLGLILTKEVAETSLGDLTYDLVGGGNQQDGGYLPLPLCSEPDIATETTFYNLGKGTEIEQEFAYNKMVGQQKCWEEVSETAGWSSLSVSGSVPFFGGDAGVSSQKGWSTRDERSDAACTDDQDMVEVTTTVVIPEESVCVAKHIQCKATLRGVSFNGNIKMRFKAGTTVVSPVRGTYKGTQALKSEVVLACVQEEEELSPGAIAGIVASCLLLLVLVVGGVYAVRRRRRRLAAAGPLLDKHHTLCGGRSTISNPMVLAAAASA